MQVFGSSSFCLMCFLRSVGVFFLLRALFPASCYNTTCLFFFFVSFSYTTPLAYIRSKKEEKGQGRYLVLLHLHVRGVLFTWIQLWNSHLFLDCGRGVRLLGWLAGYSALLCGCLIVLIVSLHIIPLLLMVSLTSILFTCGLEDFIALRYL